MPYDLFKSLQNYIPPNYSGIEYCQQLDKWLEEDKSREQQAYKLLREWLLLMREMHASDIDFGAPGANRQIWYRVYGTKKPMKQFGELEYYESAAIILSCISPSQKQILYMKRSVDFSLDLTEEGRKARFRGTGYFDQGYLCCNFRRINDVLYTIDGLRIPKPIATRLNLGFEKTGLILITGITGSGKSTTLDAIIDMNNRDNDGHIVIIGHPIEYVHDSKRCLVRHREVGVDVLSFEAGSVEALRQDPDIIVIGEMRDPRTIATVLEITDSGHKAFSTLHTSSAIDSIHRIIAEFPAEEQERIRNRLADVLTVIMSQKLVPTVDGKLVMAKEILSVDASVQAAIRNKNIGEIYQMMVEGRKLGMTTLEQDLLELFKRGIITNISAMSYANNKKRMMQLLAMP
ncbi:MAG: twitching motility protein PilT [Candidatus Cloacimonetes bacterium HGW-Cloacimonetes-2]|jgi:twitching motility protein PilT|nr:MAG: twitching motility protein PilT [Candidatus Cloacimonetes bacterium HGW-Cloacimonetes-2]